MLLSYTITFHYYISLIHYIIMVISYIALLHYFLVSLSFTTGDTLIYEVRVAFFENGILKQWKARLNNPIATNQFVNLFAPPEIKIADNGDKFSSLVTTTGTDDNSNSMYDSNFSEMVLEFLPELPEGVDLFDTSTYFVFVFILFFVANCCYRS